MEISSKSKCIKKRHKKKRIRIPDNDLVPLVNPEVFDGVSNWTRMQKILGSVKDEKLKKVESNILKIPGINPKDYKPPFGSKRNNHTKTDHSSKKIEESSPVKNKDEPVEKNKHSVVKTYASMVSGEKSKTPSQPDQKEQFTFSFNANHKKADEISEDKVQKKQQTFNNKKLTKAVAMDCEMVGTGPTGDDSIIARVSIVNSNGDCLYDEFVKPKEKVTDYRTKISGVRPSDLKNGKDLFEVQRNVLQIIEGRILVGHSVKHDLDVLFISHPRQLIRDTAYYRPFRDLCGGRTPSLKKLTSLILGCEIQSGEHSSVEDAQATMLLYLRQRHEWETEVRSQRKRRLKVLNRSTN